MHIIKESNGVEYEISNKQWVIIETFSENAKKGLQLFVDLGSEIVFPVIDVLKNV